MHVNARILLSIWSVAFWTKAEKTVLDNLDACDPALIARIEPDMILPTQDMETQLEENFPWKVNFANYKENPKEPLKVLATVFTKDNIEITVTKDGTSEPVKQIVKVNWKGLLKGDSSSNLKFYIWQFQSPAAVFGYYLCKSNAKQTKGRVKPHFGVAVGYGRVGGLPDEALSGAEQVKNNVQEVFYGDILNFLEYDMDSEVPKPTQDPMDIDDPKDVSASKVGKVSKDDVKSDDGGDSKNQNSS